MPGHIWNYMNIVWHYMKIYKHLWQSYETIWIIYRTYTKIYIKVHWNVHIYAYIYIYTHINMSILLAACFRRIPGARERACRLRRHSFPCETEGERKRVSVLAAVDTRMPTSSTLCVSRAKPTLWVPPKATTYVFFIFL